MAELNFPPSKLEIAIVGGGIAGLTATIALLKHPLIQITIYEKAAELKEIGASIALGPNGLRTLERLGLQNVISDDIAFRGPSNIPMIYRHWETNEVIGFDEHQNVTEHLHRSARYHRAHLHQALLSNVPKQVIQLNKKLNSVKVNEKGVVLEFRDGTTATADLLIGADGINSGVRKAFVPDFPLHWSGWTAIRATFPTSLVENIPDLPEDSTHWWGPNTSFFASRLGKNTFTIVGGLQEDPVAPSSRLAGVSWDDKASVELLKDIYKEWNPVIKALVDATAPENLRFHPNLSCSEPLETWVFEDRVTLIGDAAHAHGGAFATGGSLAIDDAYTLSLALLSIFPRTAKAKPSREELSEALSIYEETRKPHAERLLRKVHELNTIKVERLRRNEVESDDQLRERARKGSSTAWLHEHDTVGAFEATLERRKNLSSENTSLDISARL